MAPGQRQGFGHGGVDRPDPGAGRGGPRTRDGYDRTAAFSTSRIGTDYPASALGGLIAVPARMRVWLAAHRRKCNFVKLLDREGW